MRTPFWWWMWTWSPGPGGRSLPTPDDNDFKFSTIITNSELINNSERKPRVKSVSRMCCFFTQRVTQVRNVDGTWSLQARGADADLHRNADHLHGTGNRGLSLRW